MECNIDRHRHNFPHSPNRPPEVQHSSMADNVSAFVGELTATKVAMINLFEFEPPRHDSALSSSLVRSVQYRRPMVALMPGHDCSMRSVIYWASHTLTQKSRFSRSQVTLAPGKRNGQHDSKRRRSATRGGHRHQTSAIRSRLKN